MVTILQNNHLIFLIITGILGVMVGSFLNVVIYRLPIMLKREWEKDCHEYLKQTIPTKYAVFNLSIPSSHCPICAAPVLWWQNIPIISYILLRGKCANCKATIHWRYPAIELLSCLTSLLVASHFGISLQALAVLILTWMLIAATFIDLDHQLLPDNITLPLVWLGLLLNTNYLFTTPENAIIGAASGYLILWLIAYLFKLIRKIDGMGYGDFKLLAVFGAWLGWQILPLILFTASLIGSIIGISLMLNKNYRFTKPIAFGPYLAITGWLAFFWGQDILNWYLNSYHW